LPSTQKFNHFNVATSGATNPIEEVRPRSRRHKNSYETSGAVNQANASISHCNQSNH
jgi:hypothetical protein